MTALFAAPEVAAPERRLSADAVRDAIWDVLHDRPPTAIAREIAGNLVFTWRSPRPDSPLWLENRPELRARLKIENGG